MVAFEDSSIASSRQWRWYTWTQSHSAPIAHTRAAFYSVVEGRVTTGKEERWPSGWRAVASLYRRMIVYAEQDGVLFMQVTQQ